MDKSVDPLADVEYAAAFEFLRYTIRIRLAQYGSLKEMAKSLSLDTNALRQFLSGGQPSKLLWDALTPIARENPELADSGMVGLALIADTFPMRHRLSIRRLLGDVLVAYLRERRQPIPAWLKREIDLR